MSKRIVVSIIGFLLIYSNVSAVNSDEISTTPTIIPNLEQKLRDQYQNQKEEFKEGVNEVKDQVQEAVNLLKEEHKVRIEEIKDELLQKAMSRFISHMDRVSDHLARIKEKINASAGLTEQEKNAALTEIDGLISEFETMKEAVLSADTRESFQEVAQQVRDMWQKINDLHKKYMGLHMSGRFQNHLDRLEAVAVKIQERVNTLSDQGIDMGDVQAALDNFTAQIAVAEEKIADAKAQFNSIIAGSGNAQSLFENGVNILREAKQDLYEAGRNLKDAIQTVQDVVTASDDE